MEKKQLLFKSSQILCIIIFFVLLSHSGLVLFYAKKGIRTWALSVLPVLLPFIILSKFWIYYDVPKLFFFFSKKVLAGHSSLAVSIPVLFLGLTSGFPVGAIFVKYFYDNRILTKESAEELLPLCSFISPMFLIGYVKPLTGYHGILWLLFLIALYLPLFIFFFKGIYYKSIYAKETTISLSSNRMKGSSSIRDIWLSSLEIILTIGIYMMLFSILFGLATEQPLFSSPFFKIILSNLEITTGIGYLAKMSIPAPLRGFVLAISVSFGGGCTFAQISTIIGETSLSLKRYLRIKAMTAFLSGCLFFLGQCF